MITTLAVVEVHPEIAHLQAGSPLAGMARRRFGGKSLLEWVVRRVSDAERISGIVVLGADDGNSRRLCMSCPPGVAVLHARGDALGRLATGVRKLPCYGIVRLS